MDKIQVLIVDDSAVVRSVLTGLLSAEPDIEVVGAAVDPYDARKKIKQLRPDVLTLDIEMPKMDGITFLKNLMKLNPMPVVMLSSLTQDGADATLQALEFGAVDYIAKPTATDSDVALKLFQRELVSKIQMAAESAKKLKFMRSSGKQEKVTVQLDNIKLDNQIVAIGSSAGGTEALHKVIQQLPEVMPPIIVTQHIPASFSERFASRLNRSSVLKVVEAKNDDVLRPGYVYLAPGDSHLTIQQSGCEYVCRLDTGDKVNRHKPSVEVMFDSLLPLTPLNVTGVMLTGMGEDGAQAMKRLLDAGAFNIVQDEATSLVWGMPGAAVKAGAASEIVPLHKIAQRIVGHLSE
ncbi:MAG: chemotaxis response regulator protein-glutamate methylesterase [Neptuniibacter caesariensis]|uniref:Protein-glutamate methylesterase/protein-glutamine glutaminase n=1 Tax=Neptuniibacter caesariensis TaxID=207954 RepID=A0A2G6JSE9_NEPCE|nr:MAG: chemotaxis response regulator protein-glutamate methylesterase [Neptuniibacter caesariensis]